MKLNYLTLLFAIIFMVSPDFSFCQTSRKVAILDMTTLNAETNASRFIAVENTIRSIGVPYVVCTDISQATQHPIVITGSRISTGKLNSTQKNALKSYVQNGGVIITSRMEESGLFDLCGISSKQSTDTLYLLKFDTLSSPVFNYINDSLEVTISLGRKSSGPTFSTYFYTPSTAVSLAKYENNQSGLLKNTYGLGTVYTFGPDLRDVTLRNQLDLDVNAQRGFSNSFEPTSDVIILLIRNIIQQHIPHTLYKYTTPGTYSSSILLTHDIDSKTGLDTMLLFSTYEKNNNLQTHYNITTRYTHDTWMSNFYLGSWQQVHQLIQDGHTIASHSVGHFPDFDNETRFPLGQLGNTPSNYSPHYTAGMTSGGSVLGELEVSKKLLEVDHLVPIRSFRAGHLCYNDTLALGMEQLGYQFNSTSSANNVLSSFPYYAQKIRSFSSSPSKILEIPMTISDVFNAAPIDSTNYLQKVAIWNDVTNRTDANHAPTVLLIHPNRTYKLSAQIAYLSQLPSSAQICSMEKYGEFWNKRDSLTFHTTLYNNTLLVQFTNSYLSEDQSFVLNYLGLDTVIFTASNGASLNLKWIPWDYGTRLYYQDNAQQNSLKENTKTQLTLYPNPTNGLIHLSIPSGSSQFTVRIYDISGKVILQSTENKTAFTLNLSEIQQSGMYFLQVSDNLGNLYHSKVQLVK